MELQEKRRPDLKRLKEGRRKPVQLPQGELVTFELLDAERLLPLVVRPAVEGLDLPGWVEGNLPEVNERLLRHGALLFRGFGLNTPADFRRVAEVLCTRLGRFAANIYPPPKSETSSRTGATYPAEIKLRWHNEDTFDNYRWPSKIMFYCAKSAPSGGETPIADCRELLRLVPAHTREKFMSKGVMFVKNYYEELGMSWQKDFETTDEAEMARRCRAASIDWSWREGGRLRLSYVRPAVVKHPRTGEPVWFNQAQLAHISFLAPEVRDLWASSFREEDYPFNCYFGDGSPISGEEMNEVCRAYEQVETTFSWRERDLLVLDNMLASHARNPFEGEREIYVAMDELLNHDVLANRVETMNEAV